MLTWAFAACAAGAPATEETAATPAAAPAPFRKPRRPTPVVDRFSEELAEAISCVIFSPLGINRKDHIGCKQFAVDSDRSLLPGVR
jgi:hypothetical protein